MNVGTILLDFRLRKCPDRDTLESSVVTPIQNTFSTSLREIFRSSSAKVQSWMFSDDDPESPVNVWIRLWLSEKENIHILTVNIEYSSERCKSLVNGDIIETEHKIQKNLTEEYSEISKSLPLIRRGLKFSPYLTTSDDRIVEYKFDEIIFSKRSEYQEITIANTKDHGRVLLLDDIVNIAEGDTEAYTKFFTLNFDFQGKRILILGGGDGGLLKEILESGSEPSFVTMIEIDEIVLEAVRQNMRSVCGPYLDQYEGGGNYRIIIGDAFEEMRKMIDDEREFDFVFSDLTDTPVTTSSSVEESRWKLIRSALELGLKLLKPGIGKYVTHCNGGSVPKILEAFERLITKEFGCSFVRKESFVPSFMEKWVFYQITPEVR